MGIGVGPLDPMRRSLPGMNARSSSTEMVVLDFMRMEVLLPDWDLFLLFLPLLALGIEMCMREGRGKWREERLRMTWNRAS